MYAIDEKGAAMFKVDFNELEIRILLKCNEGLLKRTYMSSIYHRFPLKERKQAINKLIEGDTCRSIRRNRSLNARVLP